MPPRIPPCCLPEVTPSQCFRMRPPRSTCDKSSSHLRQFHTSSRHATRLRRDMFAWLNGPGRALRDPLKGSTNYMSAYDRSGSLIRANKDRDERPRRGRIEINEADLDRDEKEVQARELEEGMSEEEVRKRARLRAAKRGDREIAEERGGIPPERASDLRPYPQNREFRSQAVLSESLREKIYQLVAVDGLDLKSVSATFGVDIRRVAAVVRLKTIEKKWVDEGKKLAKPYSEAIMSMLPQTKYAPNRPPRLHESINDLPIHPATRHQIFVPVSESRAFTREDAAKAFHPNLLPADQRIAHPELIQLTKWELQGHDRETRQRMMRERDAGVQAQTAEKERKRKEWEARTQVIVPGRRWDFKFQDVSVTAEKTGKDGRGRSAIGLRYGMPLEDRKKGQVKIPTRVE